ncbi:tetratricopeptide repeat protein [Nitrosomonas sp. H1_AOB3]|uniref:YfgM family protein n=1 Tax=Nitrosomonas sp. H1_AOB3 TaxID=2741553 RepID=UPI001937AF77|nr:tetratricopeptide repeat protein [Nitrosomonas sp. H1_AOB3]QOJ09779.1 MAG: tetratricopeptide repeat protein [Nitrosomonas sp. H1_AOB3]
MSAYNFEEQEKIEGLKSWWAANGTTMLFAIAVFAATVAGNRLWNHYKAEQAQQAADLYAVLQQQVEKGSELVKITDAAHLLTEGFPGSGYASRAALIAARAAGQAGNDQVARDMLQWALDHAEEPEIKDMARLRLASVLVDESKYDQALKLLDAQHAASFTGLYADLRGDALAAAGKTDEARAAYQKALDSLNAQGAYRDVVQMKLDVLREQRQ